MNASGPDIPAILCRTPDACCGPSPCDITEELFICQIRSLLPEGDLYNTTLPSEAPATGTTAIGAITVGCSKVGCEQLVFGGCCEEEAACDLAPTAPQLAVVDTFSAVAFRAVEALCKMLRELDPCTADLTLRRWGQRYGLVSDDLCAKQWSDHVLATLLCVMLQIRLHLINFDYLQRLAARFGADITMHAAGDFNCGPSGWWSMARERAECPQDVPCPPGAFDATPPWIRLVPTCASVPDSLNLVLSPADIRLPDNCNNPPVPSVLPHDPELYEALKWLLPRILPQPVFWCIYERDEANCIV